jgi:hypothetical protein
MLHSVGIGLLWLYGITASLLMLSVLLGLLALFLGDWIYEQWWRLTHWWRRL